MKNMQTVITAVAEAYGVSAKEVRHDLRAYLAHLMEDPEFRAAWEMIPKEDALPAEEMLLAMMIAEHAAQTTNETEKSSFDQ